LCGRSSRRAGNMSLMKRRVIVFSVLALVALAALWAWRLYRIESRYLPQIRAAAQRYQVDPLLVRAVAWRESGLRAGAHGTRGELGLMQIQEIAAQEWADADRVRSFTHADCLDPETNTLAGTFYLGKLLKRYAGTDDPVPYALADYNAGRGNVLKWTAGGAATNSAAFIGQIGFPTTKRYVKSVMRRRAWYQFLSRLGW
jgi:soluble lytic murein transglycosylase